MAIASGDRCPAALAPAAAAHPLGNFTVNQYSRIEIGATEARLVYVLDLAELPTVADRPLLDSDGTARSPTRSASRTSMASCPRSPRAPPLRWLDRASLRPTAQSLALVPGQAGLDTTRIEATFVADLPPIAGDAGQITFRNDYASDRLGWREIVVANGPDVSVDNQRSSPSTDQTRCASIPTTCSPARSTSGP